MRSSLTQTNNRLTLLVQDTSEAIHHSLWSMTPVCEVTQLKCILTSESCKLHGHLLNQSNVLWSQSISLGHQHTSCIVRLVILSYSFAYQRVTQHALLSGVPDYFDRNKILSGGDLSHYQVPHCIRVFFYFVWFVFIHHNFQFYFELCTCCNILDIYLS